ncbi:hypothetical protein JTE90_007791 [Oedothorax gibbosus]|uniref:MD-2-related lipid-recognition domain-containing protein n=1 Tax=Oedothorax gibbosus TaxID=931172 RepID=A0AAV6UCY6_9ARAC|nr:hypothetical protein JTE90_007791 [Oedothorax gibbosus]
MLAFISLSTASPFKDCNPKGKEAKVKSVDVSGCDNNAQRCELQRGSDITVSIKFTPKKAVDALKANLAVGGSVYSAEVPLDEPDVCKVVRCPLQKDQEYTYTTKFHVPDDAITFSVKAIPNAAEELIVCAEVPGVITKKAKPAE